MTDRPMPLPLDALHLVAGGMRTGTEGGESLAGTGGDDTILALGGDDTVDGGAGSDRIEGGAGGDVLSGGDGHDTMSGGDGSDSLSGGAGLNMLDGGAGNDSFSGARPGDGQFAVTTALGGAGDDSFDFSLRGHEVTVVGGEGTDTLILQGSDPRLLMGNVIMALEVSGVSFQLTDYGRMIVLPPGVPELTFGDVTFSGIERIIVRA